MLYQVMMWPSTDLNRTGKQFLIKICSSRTRYHQCPISTDTSECSKHILTFKTQPAAASIASFLIQKLDCHLPLSPWFICIDDTLFWIHTTFSFHLGKLSCREAFKLVCFLCNKAEMWRGRKGHVLLLHCLWICHFTKSLYLLLLQQKLPSVLESWWFLPGSCFSAEAPGPQGSEVADCFAVHAAQHYEPEQHSAMLSNLDIGKKPKHH